MQDAFAVHALYGQEQLAKQLEHLLKVEDTQSEGEAAYVLKVNKIRYWDQSYLLEFIYRWILKGEIHWEVIYTPALPLS